MTTRLMDSVAAVGDAGDPGTWSGIPWHFAQAALAAGWPIEPWRLDMTAFRWPRRQWNLSRVLGAHESGGYQYSAEFLTAAEAQIPAALKSGRVLSFHQQFPRVGTIAAQGGELLHYIDATFASFCDEGGLAAHLPLDVRLEACRLERENLQRSEKVATMARWAADSVAGRCGVSRVRVATILPGANIDLPADYAFPVVPGWPGRDRPLVLGFVGKDWQRKGLPFLLEVRDELERRGIRATVRCAGHAPAELARRAGVSFAGFIDKQQQPGEFLRFLAGCDVGCLFSSHEPLGISTLEFLRAGVPVTGFAVEGLLDTLPPDAGWSFSPSAKAAQVADVLQEISTNAGCLEKKRAGARAWSEHLTWVRCFREWEELLGTGAIAAPVQPWRGAAGRPKNVAKEALAVS